jgi:hypothetical protein
MPKTNSPSFSQQNSTKIGVAGVWLKIAKGPKLADPAPPILNIGSTQTARFCVLWSI